MCGILCSWGRVPDGNSSRPPPSPPRTRSRRSRVPAGARSRRLSGTRSRRDMVVVIYNTLPWCGGHAFPPCTRSRRAPVPAATVVSNILLLIRVGNPFTLWAFPLSTPGTSRRPTRLSTPVQVYVIILILPIGSTFPAEPVPGGNRSRCGPGSRSRRGPSE
jgi:hypothetical protein